MTIEERLKQLILQRYGTMREFSKQIGMSQSTFATIMNRGIHKASIGNVIKICQALQISADKLANDRIVSIKKDIPFADLTDILEMLEYIRNHQDEFSDLTIDGQPLSKTEWHTILNSLTLSVEFVRHIRKERK